MKYEDAKKLEVGDKIAVLGTVKEIDETDETQTLQIMVNDTEYWLYNKNILGKLPDFQQDTSDEAQKPIALTAEQTSEFDAIMHELTGSAIVEDIKDVLEYIKRRPITYPSLKEYLFGNDDADENLNNQINFVKLIENPELLTVKNDLYALRIADGYLQYDFAWRLTTDIGYAKKFTDDELEELKKDPDFASINIDKAKTKLAY